MSPDTSYLQFAESLRPGGGLVQSQDGTAKPAAHKAVEPTTYADVDGLFQDSASYATYKREKPEHRLMLWYRLNGHNVKETALAMGYTPQSVSQVCKQPWFREAFCRLSSEAGKDAVQTFLEGEVLPAVQRVVDLAHNGETDAVKLAANRELLDRFLGKATVKIEAKHSGTVDSVVYDAQKLIDENNRIRVELQSRIGTN